MGMRKKKYAVILTFLAFVLIIIMSGCAKEDKKEFFDSVEQQISSEMAGSDTARKEAVQAEEKDTIQFSIMNLPEHWYNFGVYAKRWAAVIIIGSIVIGWVIYDIFKKNREVQKWAFDLLIVRIPVFTFIIVYLYAFLYRMLNL